MKIGVVGDTHNRMPNVERIVTLFREARIERVIHTGDITQPKVLERFAALEVPFLGVYGNNDLCERRRLEDEANRFGMDLTDPPRVLEWAGRQIMVVHDPVEAPETLPLELDLVLHGHTHRHRHERQGGTLIFNPGECAGHREGANAVGLIDLVSLETELIKF
jgi:putative phosphoesterase